MQDWEYLGWVPCLNGHLDFGLMTVGIQGDFTGKGEKYTDRRIIEINRSAVRERDSHQRRILLQSKVNWKDSETFNDEDGWFRVFVRADVTPSSSMDERSLTGYILIYPLLAEPASYDEKMKMCLHRDSHELKKLSDEVDRIKYQLDDSSSQLYDLKLAAINNKFDQFDALIKGEVESKGFDYSYFFSCFRFHLEPNGLIWISSYKSNVKPDIEYVVARQAYYYLKYALHTHKHHQSTQDALTTLVPLNKSDTAPCLDASLRLVCQLKRELTALNRIKSLSTHRYKDHLILNDSCGIIAYGKALIRSLKDKSIFDEQIYSRELERFDDLKSSSDALNNRIEKVHSITELVSAKSKVIAGIFFGLVYFLLASRFKAVSSSVDLEGIETSTDLAGC